MKVLLVNNYAFNRGGAEKVFFNLYSLLKSKGLQVKSLSRFTKGDSKNSVDYLIPDNQFFFNRFYSISAKKIIRKILETEKPDIVHIHNIVGGVTFSILPEIKKHKIPIVASIHDFRLLCPVSIMVDREKNICEKCGGSNYFYGILKNCHPDGQLKSLMVVNESYLRDLFLSHTKFFDAYIFVSNFTMQKFLTYKPEIYTKSFVLYNFNDTYDSEIIRGDYFLYFGRLDREKGILTLLSAFKELTKQKLVIVGTGPFSNSIDEFNSNGNIQYLGFKEGEALKDLIKKAYFIIIPSECYENLPMSVVESLSLSKPIITSGLGGLQELLNNGKNGFEFEAKSVESLKKVIDMTSKLSDLDYESYSRNCYNFAKNNFDPENYFHQLMNIYEKLLSQK